MSRQLYLHHYLPALYFSILLLVSRIDRFWQKWSKHARYSAGLALMGIIILSWFVFSPLAYGSDFGSKALCERLRVLGGWKFTCQRQDLPWARPHSARAVADAIQTKGTEQDSDVPHFYASDDSSFDGFEGDVDAHHEEESWPERTEEKKKEAEVFADYQEKMARAAEARVKEINEKNALMAEKEALELKQRALEERLKAQDRLLEQQRIIQDNIQREGEESQRPLGQQQQEQHQEQQHQDDAQYEERRQKVLQAMVDKHAESHGAPQMVSDETRQALEEQIRLLQAQLGGSQG